MQSVAFVAPILPGKTEADRSAMQSVAHGERKAAYASSRERHGITREAVWIQQTPGGDAAVVYLEADDLQAAFAGIGSSQEPFDSWFRAGGAPPAAGTPPTTSPPSTPHRDRVSITLVGAVTATS